MQLLNKWLIYILNPSNKSFYFLFALVVKVLFLFFSNNQFPNNSLYPGLIAYVNGDATEYITSSINIHQLGFYYPYGKMPGYSLLIAFLLNLFTLKTALVIVVCLQVLLDAVACYFLAKIVYVLTSNKKVFNVVYFLAVFSTYISLYNRFILADSLATSILVILIYVFVMALKQLSLAKVGIAGLLFSAVVFLRPALFILIFPIAAVFFLPNKQIVLTLKLKLKYLFIFLVPFIIADAFWLNYSIKQNNDYHPLMSFNFYKHDLDKTFLWEKVAFVQAWGGNTTNWDPRADIIFFEDESKMGYARETLPDYIYCSRYNFDSLSILKKQIAEYRNSGDIYLLKTIKWKFNEYTKAFKKERYLMYWLSPFLLVKVFVLNSGGTYNLFANSFQQLSFFDKAIKLFYVGLYFFIALGGLIGALFTIFFNRKDFAMLLCSLYILGSIILICYIYRAAEYRYFVSIYPICLITLGYYMFYFRKKLWSSK